MDPFDLLNQHCHVSRETFDRLSIYSNELIKWQARVNLVSPDTIPNLWERHFLDSLQLIKLIPNSTKRILDLGSGAGFPGLIISIAGGKEVTLVESDMKKCIFMKEVIRLASANAQVINKRIEDCDVQSVDMITSRALADLNTLLSMAFHFVSRETICLFPKGKNYAMELEQAKQEWSFDVVAHPSITDTSAVVLEITNLSRA